MTDAQPQRADLCRSVPFQLRADDTEPDDGFTIHGVVTPFDSPTLIDSWEGTFFEQMAYGAFRKSLSERTPRMQFDHGYHPLLGSIPLGRWTSMREERGLGVDAVGRLHDTWLHEPVRLAVAEGSIDGMSIRFTVVRDEWRDSAGKLLRDPKEIADLLWNPGDRGPLQRTIKEAKMTEAGPVVWPAYEATSVGVRSKVTIDLGRLRDPAERRKLADAIYAAEAAERDETHPERPTETTDAPPATGGQPSEAPATPDAPPPSTDPPAGHPSQDTSSQDAPPADRSQPGQHPSAEPLSRKSAEDVRAFARSCRGYLLSIERN